MPHFTRRAALALSAGMLTAPAVHAQGAFPNKPLRIIVPYPPGGVTDIMGRLAAEAMARHLGQPVVVENRAGAGGNIGVGVGMMADMPNVMSCLPRRYNPASAREAIARAKAEPGKMTFGTVGNGSSAHLSLVMLEKLAGLDFVHVPYRGSAPAVAAMLAGDLDLLFDASATSAPHILQGSMKGLAITMDRRIGSLPDIPTLQEEGVAGYHLSVWNGVFTQSRVPAPILARLQDAFNKSMDEAMLNRLRGHHTEPLLIPTAELQPWLDRDAQRWGQVARDSGIKID
jgi:tripartite-type tricarboxylate transporter receptor subunit TctC